MTPRSIMYWSLSLKFSGVPDSSTAFAKALRLWNHARERLQAIETAIVANLMPTGTALFALLIVWRDSFPERAGWDDPYAFWRGFSRVTVISVNHGRTCPG